jgi:hypothetical protein
MAEQRIKQWTSDKGHHHQQAKPDARMSVP